MTHRFLTSNSTRFGIAMGVGRRDSLEDVGKIARTADELGFASLWIQDNPLTVKDAYVALTVAAVNTDNIRIGPGVSNPVVRHPSVIANAIATLHDATGGRAFLGLGSGGPALLQPLGFKPGRARAFKEELQQICSLLHGDKNGSARELNFRIAADGSGVPVYVAANGPRMCRAAGSLADGIMIGGPILIPRLKQRIGWFRDAADREGRDTQSLRVNLLINVAIDDGTENWLRTIKPFVLAWIQSGELQPGRDIPAEYSELVQEVTKKHDPSRHLSMRDPEIEAIPDELAKTLTVAGNESECRAKVEELLRLGPLEITISLPSRNRTERLRSLASLVSGL